MKKKLLIIFAAFALAVTLIVLGIYGAVNYLSDNHSTNAPDDDSAQTITPPAGTTGFDHFDWSISASEAKRVASDHLLFTDDIDGILFYTLKDEQHPLVIAKNTYLSDRVDSVWPYDDVYVTLHFDEDQLTMILVSLVTKEIDADTFGGVFEDVNDTMQEKFGDPTYINAAGDYYWYETETADITVAFYTDDTDDTADLQYEIILFYISLENY